MFLTYFEYLKSFLAPSPWISVDSDPAEEDNGGDGGGGGGATDPTEVKNPNALLKAHEETKKENKHLKERLAGMERKLQVNDQILSKIDPEKYEELQQQAKAADELREKLSKREAELMSQHQESLQSLEKRYVQTIDTEKQINNETIKSFLLTQEYVKYGKPELAELFNSGYSDRFQLVFDGDRPTLNNTKLIALGDDGKPRYVKAKDTSEMVEMGLGDWLEAMKEDKAISVFIPAPQSKGTGTHSMQNGGYRAHSGVLPKNANEAFANLPTFSNPR